MASSRDATSSYLVWSSRGRLGAIPSCHVAEIMRPLRVQALADAPPFVAGVSLIRGMPTPIVDAGVLISAQTGVSVPHEARAQTGVSVPHASGGTDTPVCASRVVVVKVGEKRRVGLAVDDVVGIREFSGPVLDDLPPLLRDVEHAAISSITVLDGDLMIVLETARIVPERIWAGLEKVGA